ncbi:hypothetical protein J437_LFUL013916 [Ladona fulva]|uniref:Uncharacterized protein n=1 Tax=Ladona fulva TaxID=123851 RepID=A0A8K0KKL9_LADFU|nr:hypothetical protein J437_LFUL013916 [Ladona fulva]
MKWSKKKKDCPVCRTVISKNVRTKMIDNFVEKLVARFPADYQERRKEILESRKELTQALTENPRPRKRRKRSITAASRNGRQAITITLQNLGSLMDTTIDISSDDDSPGYNLRIKNSYLLHLEVMILYPEEGYLYNYFNLIKIVLYLKLVRILVVHYCKFFILFC